MKALEKLSASDVLKKVKKLFSFEEATQLSVSLETLAHLIGSPKFDNLLRNEIGKEPILEILINTIEKTWKKISIQTLVIQFNSNFLPTIQK